MKWGRAPRRTSEEDTRITLPRSAYAVMITGALVCAVFFGMTVTGENSGITYPPEKGAAAREAFGRDHAALTAVLGIDAYFPEDAVAAGAFGERGRRWTFSEYLRDALHTVLFGDSD